MLSLSSLQSLTIPHAPGVYLFSKRKNMKNGSLFSQVGKGNKQGGQVLYVGKAKDLHKRLHQYFAPGSMRKQDMLAQADKVERIETGSESEALLLEEHLIKQYQPEYNRLLKNNKRYFYVKITTDRFPKILLTRYKKEDKAIYIGPKHNVHLLRKFLDYLRYLYQIRTCSQTEFRRCHKAGVACSKYDFGLCGGWCLWCEKDKEDEQNKEGEQDKEDEQDEKGRIGGKRVNRVKKDEQGEKRGKRMNKMNKMNRIKDVGQKYFFAYGEEDVDLYFITIKKAIQRFFQGDTEWVKKDLEAKIQQAIKIENFERAQELKQMYLAIDDRVQRQTVVVQKPLSGIVSVIREVGTFWVVVIATLFKGKIIDVMRTKELTQEVDYSTLIIALRQEYGLKGSASSSLQGGTMASQVGENEQHGQDNILKYGDCLLAVDRRTNKQERQELFAFLDKAVASFIASDSFEEHSVMNSLLQQLQEKYGLHMLPYHIECVDISHLGGEYTSGGLSCMKGGVLYKPGYRRYNIKTAKNNDYQALKELVGRRFHLTSNTSSSEREIEQPDLFILDGGKGQLAIFLDLMKEFPQLSDIMTEVTFVALGKGEARKKTRIGRVTEKHGSNSKKLEEMTIVSETVYYFGRNYTIQELSLTYDEADRLLIKLRDEAHRFANAYRKIQHQREWK